MLKRKLLVYRGNRAPLICLINQYKYSIIIIIISLGFSALTCNSHSQPTTAVIPQLRLEVLNGAGVHRLGRAVERDLLTRGFDVYRVGDADRVYEQTAVVDLRDKTGKNAQAVAAALGIRKRVLGVYEREVKRPMVQIMVDSSSFYEVRIVIGKDYQQFFPQAVLLY